LNIDSTPEVINLLKILEECRQHVLELGRFLEAILELTVETGEAVLDSPKTGELSFGG
jgi:hypothetical protein